MSQDNQLLTLPWNDLSKGLRLDLMNKFFINHWKIQPVQKDTKSLKELGKIAALELFEAREKDTTDWCKAWDAFWPQLKNNEKEAVAAGLLQGLSCPMSSSSVEQFFGEEIAKSYCVPSLKKALNKILIDISSLNDPWRHVENVSDYRCASLTLMIFGRLPPDNHQSLVSKHPGLGAAYAWLLSGSSRKYDKSKGCDWPKAEKALCSFVKHSSVEDQRNWSGKIYPVIDKMFMDYDKIGESSLSSHAGWWQDRGLFGWASANTVTKSFDNPDSPSGFPIIIYDRALSLLPKMPNFLKSLTKSLKMEDCNEAEVKRMTQAWMITAAWRDNVEAFLSFDGLVEPVRSAKNNWVFWKGMGNSDQLPSVLVPFFHDSPKLQLAIARDANLSETIGQWFKANTPRYTSIVHQKKGAEGQPSDEDVFMSAFGAFREARLLAQVNSDPIEIKKFKI